MASMSSEVSTIDAGASGRQRRSDHMNLFVFGVGYSALHFIRHHRNGFVSIAGTARSQEKADSLASDRVDGLVFSDEMREESISERLMDSDDLIVSVPPDASGDPVLRHYEQAIKDSPVLRRIIYLSTIGVYGNHNGEWVDEETPVSPASARSKRRAEAERQWQSLAREKGCELHILRLAGIYGPGRNAIANLRAGTAKRIVKEGQVFNRIHVEDIARAMSACMHGAPADAVRIWNVTDDMPAPPQNVVTFAAGLISAAPPPMVNFEEAEMSEMARSFYSENKRVSNAAIKEALDFRLTYPTYRDGLAALMKAELAEA